jgi:hypothetical protein
MAKLTGKLGEWQLPHVHMWKDRRPQIQWTRQPLISPDTSIATIGSCFASEIAAAMGRFELKGAMHPGGLFYTTPSIRQEIERIFGGWPQYRDEPYWKVADGYVHPFKSYYHAVPDADELRAWSDRMDADAARLFRSADLIVITLGLIEAWMNPATGNVYRQIPHPEVFPTLGARFYRVTTAEMIQDLERIRAVIRRNTRAEIVLTVSPVALQATLTPLDVRVANTESKSRIRAAVSEFVERYPDVHYFHSYELVTTAERFSDFMLEDGRHVRPHAVDYILGQFLEMFGRDGVRVPAIDTSWITPPLKTAERPAGTHPAWRRLLHRLRRRRRPVTTDE